MRPNGLALSCAAPIDRDDSRAESYFKNARDLGAAKRRQLQRRVGPPRCMALFLYPSKARNRRVAAFRCACNREPVCAQKGGNVEGLLVP
jgi:hypothetical protein